MFGLCWYLLICVDLDIDDCYFTVVGFMIVFGFCWLCGLLVIRLYFDMIDFDC